MIEAIRSYRIQKERFYAEPFAGLGKRLNIIHLAMLYQSREAEERIPTFSRDQRKTL